MGSSSPPRTESWEAQNSLNGIYGASAFHKLLEHGTVGHMAHLAIPPQSPSISLIRKGGHWGAVGQASYLYKKKGKKKDDV